MNVEAIDLFSGIGGLTYGLQQSGIKVLAGLDNDASCAVPFETNNNSRFILADISNYDFREMKKFYSKGSVKVLVGCAPCQPFSSHTYKVKNKQDDDRWSLLDHFVRAIKVLKPDIISMENVRGLTKTEVFDNFVKEIRDLKYKIDYKIVYTPDYGVPQSRSRLVLLGSRLGKIELPEKTHSKKNYKTVGDVIRKLPKVKSGGVDPKDKVHRTKALSPLNLARIKNSRPNGSWKDWDKSLLPDCYKKETGRTYTSVYGRMSWDEVSPTITTQFYNYGSGRFGHPEQNRAISIREGALLQTFPTSYYFGEDIVMSRVSRHIGNAVPPRLGYVIGRTIKKHLNSIHGKV